ncbi:MAG: hypothetical protein RKR03_20855 [Candidatus Competibacter sp.]|nr:hypothetical protein [Candidatus Competibacter sp.]
MGERSFVLLAAGSRDGWGQGILCQYNRARSVSDRRQAEKYPGAGWPITLIGIEFGRDCRNIVGFEIEAA